MPRTQRQQHTGRLLRSDGGSRSFLATDIEYRQQQYDRTYGGAELHSPRPSRWSFSLRSAASQVCSLGALAMVGGLAMVCFLSYQMTLGAIQSSAMGMHDYIVEAMQYQPSDPLAMIFHPDTETTPTAVVAASSLSSTTTGIRYNDTTADCSPVTVQIPSNWTVENRFYQELRRRSPLPTPMFPSALQQLCDATEIAHKYQWQYCLPLAASPTDDLTCHGADRLDLLDAMPASMCTASVVHMMLMDAYDILNDSDAKPVLLGSSLRGAIRNNGSLIASAQVAELGFQSQRVPTMEKLRDLLSARGYHLFYDTVWRVCVAPTHPLASTLYKKDSSVEKLLNQTALLPHVDLYRMEPLAADKSQWFVETSQRRRVVSHGKMVEPYTHVTINGEPFDTVADPIGFLEM